MLSLARVSASHGANYFKVENYYSSKDSRGFSRWAGQDAAQLGLVGVVDHGQFSALLKGTNPTIAVAGNLSDRKRAGLDMTFSAPKSVSIQALVFGDHRLVEAHRHAVADALSYTEKHFANYRSGGRNNRVVNRGNGLLVAQFEHDSSRLKDPQLHTHNVVLNRVVTSGGEVRALHADRIYKNSVLLGLIYQNSLAKRVREAGYRIEPNAKGSFEIGGFSKDQLAVFSKRKQQILAMNPETYRHTRELVLRNRKAKAGPQAREHLLERWEKEAAQHHMQRAPCLPKQRGARGKVLPELPAAERTVHQAMWSVSIKSSVFSGQDLLKESLLFSLGRFEVRELEAATTAQIGGELLRARREDQFTTRSAAKRDLHIRQAIEGGIGMAEPMVSASSAQARVEHLLHLNTEEASGALLASKQVLLSKGLEPEKIETILGPVQLALQCKKRMTLEDLTAVRSRAARALGERNEKPKATASSPVLEEVMEPLHKAFLAPTPGQLEATAKTLTSRDRYVLWQGVAGAGKTFSVRQIVEEATRAGYDVRGFAPSATAAKQLFKETGLTTETLQSHILKREHGSSSASLWIVDEAGMISAKDFHALLVKAESSKARVLLLGDSRQLSPIEAGNPFLDVQLNTETTCIHLNQSLRQKDPLLQAVVRQMNLGAVQDGVRLLEEHIREVKTAKGQERLVAKEFLHHAASGQAATLVLARTNRSRTDATAAIRQQLKEQGYLQNEIQVPVLRKIDVSESRLTLASSYTPGDVLVPNRSYQKLGLLRDSPYEIVASHTDRNSVVVSKGGQTIEIPLTRNNQFSLFSKDTLAVAEGDKMIWNRNVKAKGQMNNAGFVVERIEPGRIQIRTDSGQTHFMDPTAAQHMEHGWALTIYKAQGQTAAKVIQCIDPGTSKRELLVGVTRAAHDVLLVARSKEDVFKSAEFDAPQAVALEELPAAARSQLTSSRGHSR